MNKVIDYEIKSSNMPSILENMVKDSIKEGWVPSGPMIYAPNDSSKFMQVMVMFDN
jgi:hypothetical protein